MGYLRRPAYIEKNAFFSKLWDKAKAGIKKVVEYSPIGLTNKAVKAVTGVDAISSATNLGSKMVSNAPASAKALSSGIAGGISSAWKGVTDPNASMMSRLAGATPIGMMWNGAKGARQGMQQAVSSAKGGAGSPTNLGNGGAHTNLG